MLERLTKIEKLLGELVKSSEQKASVVPIKKEEGDPSFIVSLVTFVRYSTIITFFLQYNGINLLRVTAKEATAYGRSLLDLLFTKTEQKQSLLYSSKKSNKPALDREKVDLLMCELYGLTVLRTRHI